jgi:hypothetical protein
MPASKESSQIVMQMAIAKERPATKIENHSLEFVTFSRRSFTFLNNPVHPNAVDIIQ